MQCAKQQHRLTSHVCRHPAWHALGVTLAMGLWIALRVCWACPKLVYWATGSAAWALTSIGVAAFLGSSFLYGLLTWRCGVRGVARRHSLFIPWLVSLAWLGYTQRAR